MTQSRGLGGRGLRGGRGHGIAFRSYSRSDRDIGAFKEKCDVI